MPVVTWPEAAGVVSALARRAAAGGVAVVGITGRVGSGKSVLAARLGAAILSTDDYLPDYEAVPYHERDEPKHLDWDRLLADIAMLRSGRGARVPVWSFQTHRREGEREVGSGPVVVCEGIHGLHERVRGVLHVGVLVEAPADVRWSRWAHIEATGQRGWGVERARAFFDEVAEPTFARREAEYRAAADVIVDNSGYRPG